MKLVKFVELVKFLKDYRCIDVPRELLRMKAHGELSEALEKGWTQKHKGKSPMEDVERVVRFRHRMVTAIVSLSTIAAVLFCLSIDKSILCRCIAFAVFVIAVLLSFWEAEETDETAEFLKKHIEVSEKLQCPPTAPLSHFKNLVSLILKRQASEIDKLEKEEKKEEALNARQGFRENCFLFSNFNLIPPGGWGQFFPKDNLASTRKEV
jgi:hypothetical protein